MWTKNSQPFGRKCQKILWLTRTVEDGDDWVKIFVCADVRCVNDNDEVVSDDFCDSPATATTTSDMESSLLAAVRPSVARTCSVPCHDDRSPACIFSHWTSWSACTRRCHGVSTRFRFMEGRSTPFLSLSLYTSLFTLHHRY